MIQIAAVHMRPYMLHHSLLIPSISSRTASGAIAVGDQTTLQLKPRSIDVSCLRSLISATSACSFSTPFRIRGVSKLIMPKLNRTDMMFDPPKTAKYRFAGGCRVKNCPQLATAVEVTAAS